MIAMSDFSQPLEKIKLEQYTNFEDLRNELVVLSKLLKNRSNFFFNFFNIKQNGFESRFEKSFFESLLKITNLNESHKQFIEDFYLKYFSYKNFKKTIKKDVRIVCFGLLTAIIINSEIILNEFLKTIDSDNIDFFLSVFFKLFTYDFSAINIENKIFILPFLEHIFNISPESITTLQANTGINTRILIPFEKLKLNIQLKDF